MPSCSRTSSAPLVRRSAPSERFLWIRYASPTGEATGLDIMLASKQLLEQEIAHPGSQSPDPSTYPHRARSGSAGRRAERTIARCDRQAGPPPTPHGRRLEPDSQPDLGAVYDRSPGPTGLG